MDTCSNFEFQILALLHARNHGADIWIHVEHVSELCQAQVSVRKSRSSG